eukprot:2008700-Pleurochrysis_carterae.AAC.4
MESTKGCTHLHSALGRRGPCLTNSAFSSGVRLRRGRSALQASAQRGRAATARRGKVRCPTGPRNVAAPAAASAASAIQDVAAGKSCASAVLWEAWPIQRSCIMIELIGTARVVLSLCKVGKIERADARDKGRVAERSPRGSFGVGQSHSKLMYLFALSEARTKSIVQEGKELSRWVGCQKLKGGGAECKFEQRGTHDHRLTKGKNGEIEMKELSGCRPTMRSCTDDGETAL